jgi:hypothetical protein
MAQKVPLLLNNFPAFAESFWKIEVAPQAINDAQHISVDAQNAFNLTDIQFAALPAPKRTTKPWTPAEFSHFLALKFDPNAQFVAQITQARQNAISDSYLAYLRHFETVIRDLYQKLSVESHGWVSNVLYVDLEAQHGPALRATATANTCDFYGLVRLWKRLCTTNARPREIEPLKAIRDLDMSFFLMDPKPVNSYVRRFNQLVEDCRALGVNVEEPHRRLEWLWQIMDTFKAYVGPVGHHGTDPPTPFFHALLDRLRHDELRGLPPLNYVQVLELFAQEESRLLPPRPPGGVPPSPAVGGAPAQPAVDSLAAQMYPRATPRQVAAVPPVPSPASAIKVISSSDVLIVPAGADISAALRYLQSAPNPPPAPAKQLEGGNNRRNKPRGNSPKNRVRIQEPDEPPAVEANALTIHPGSLAEWRLANCPADFDSVEWRQSSSTDNIANLKSEDPK